MGATVTVSLGKELGRELDEIARQEGVSPGDIVRRSVEKYVFLRRFDALCEDIQAHARKQGIYTEEDLWKRLRETE